MEKVVLDAFAILSLLEKEKGYEIVEDFLERSVNGKIEAYMNLLNWGEVYYMLIKRGQIPEAEEFWEGRRYYPIVFVEPTTKRIKEACKLKGKYSISYADALCVALAIELKAEVLTGDEEFRTVDGLKLIWIK